MPGDANDHLLGARRLRFDTADRATAIVEMRVDVRGRQRLRRGVQHVLAQICAPHRERRIGGGERNLLRELR